MSGGSRSGVGSGVTLGATVDGAFTAAAADGIVAALHIVPCGCGNMSFGFGVAGGAGVCGVMACTVRPELSL